MRNARNPSDLAHNGIMGLSHDNFMSLILSKKLNNCYNFNIFYMTSYCFGKMWILWR